MRMPRYLSKIEDCQEAEKEGAESQKGNSCLRLDTNQMPLS